MNAPRMLSLDIETSPNEAHVWGLFNQNVGLSQLMKSTEVLSFAAKWHGEEETEFYAVYDFAREKITARAQTAMIRSAWKLLDEADVVIHYNGKRFDMPHLRREFLRAGMAPPSPVQEIDLLSAAKRTFRFTSNKLDYVSQYVGLKGKVHHSGHSLWVQCLAGDLAAWEMMREYNKFDVVLTEQLYDKLQAWIPAHPHMGLFQEGAEHVCQRCGGTEMKKQGFAYTLTGKYQQYQCLGCRSWSRGKRSLQLQDERGIQ